MSGVQLVFVIALVAVLCSEFAFAAPKPNPLAAMDRQELVQRFVEFLHEDKELAGALENVNWGEEHLVRNKRQSGSSTTQGIEFDSNPPEQPGFFDRAAKFVTELLQRFLKWVNSSEN